MGRGLFQIELPLASKKSRRLRWRLIQILDEKYFVSILPMDNLIHQFLRQQNSEPARAQSDLVPNLRMTHRIVSRIGDGGMGDVVRAESRPRIGDTTGNH